MTQPSTVEILQRLIRFDTTNPPGNEAACIAYLKELLGEAGIQTSLHARSEDRPNLLATVPGRGEAPPLLLFGHVDVVTTAHQSWFVPPFEGRVQDGYVWGRGALDMKSGLAMMASALLAARDEGLEPAGDVLLLAVSDEEAGGGWGARYLAHDHPELFAGVRYAIGEFGGFPLYLNGTPTYLIQAGEKQPCWMEVALRGPAGHGARPLRDGAMAKLAHVLQRLDSGRLPVHITPLTEATVRGLSDALPARKRTAFLRLLNPRWTDRVLAVLGETGTNLEPLFRNTVNATIVRGGDKPNVIPSEIALGLDARLLPGFEPDDLFDELESLLGERLPFEVRLFDRGTTRLDLGLFGLLGDVLQAAHPGARAVPYMLPGSSDARFFAKLGIQTYGFLPMNLPPGFDFFQTIHAADERIPVDAVEFGARVMLDVLRRYGAAT